MKFPSNGFLSKPKLAELAKLLPPPPEVEPMDVDGLEEVRVFVCVVLCVCCLTCVCDDVNNPVFSQVELVPLDPDTERTRRRYMVRTLLFRAPLFSTQPCFVYETLIVSR